MAALQIKRRLLSLLDCISLVLVAPLATADMRTRSIPEVFLTDASDWGRASVRGELALPLTRELQRHCLSRGVSAKPVESMAPSKRGSGFGG